MPPARFLPESAESETKLGASEPSVAVQFSGPSPVLLMLIGWESLPELILNVKPGPAVSEGPPKTLNFTSTVCGLPVIATPAFTAASEIVPLYFPAARAADVIVTVKVPLLPLATVAEAGVTASQPVPFLSHLQ